MARAGGRCLEWNVDGIRASQLVVTEAPLAGPVFVGPDMPTPAGPVIPLLVVRGGRVRIAVEGLPCRTGDVLVGLARVSFNCAGETGTSAAGWSGVASTTWVEPLRHWEGLSAQAST